MRLASVGRTASLTFALVFAPILAAALALAVVLAFTSVFRKGLFFGVCHGLKRDPRTVRRARGIRSRSDGSAQEAGYGRAGNHCLRWFHSFLSLSCYLLAAAVQ
jgi:hypothetical protein